MASQSPVSILWGHRLPYCAGKRVIPGENDLASLYPEVAAQWHPMRNGALAPTQVSPYSNRKVWWRCEKGHDYQAVAAARTMVEAAAPTVQAEGAGGLQRPGYSGAEVAAQWYWIAQRQPNARSR